MHTVSRKIMFTILAKILTITFVIVKVSPAVINNGSVGFCQYGSIQIKEGESAPAPIGECNIISCVDSKNNHIGALTCAPFVPPPGCHESELDLTKPYPKCCPRTVCNREPGYCNVDDILIKEGDTQPAAVGECMSITCKNGAMNDVVYNSCVYEEIGPNCHSLPEDESKSYPDCCPTVKCNDV